jgi:hypothetical protein
MNIQMNEPHGIGIRDTDGKVNIVLINVPWDFSVPLVLTFLIKIPIWNK